MLKLYVCHRTVYVAMWPMPFLWSNDAPQTTFECMIGSKVMGKLSWGWKSRGFFNGVELAQGECVTSRETPSSLIITKKKIIKKNTHNTKH